MIKKLIMLIAAVFIMSGCTAISQEDYDKLQEENAVLTSDLEEKDEMLRELVGNIAQLNEQVAELEASQGLGGGNGTSDEDTSTSEEHQIIDVSNAYELVSNLGSNRTFILNPGSYDLSKVNESLSVHFDGYNFIDLENVEFIGNVQLQLDFMTEDLYRPVLGFINGKNIKLSHLNMGHEPVSLWGYCEGEVLFLSNCEEVYIGNSTLYGCGTVGIYGFDVAGLTVEDSVIRDCSEDLLLLYNSQNLTFNNCEFINRTDEQLVFSQCWNVTVENSQFIGGLVTPPKVMVDDKIMYDLGPSSSKDRIVELVIGSTSLKNIEVEGNTLLIELTQLDDSVTIDLSHYYNEFTGVPSSYVTLTYEAGVELSDILKHRKSVYEVMSGYYANNGLDYEIDIYQQFGDRSIYEDYEGHLYLSATSIDWNKLNKDSKDYLSVEDAIRIATDAYLPKYKVENWKVIMEPINDHKAFMSSMIIDSDSPQYIVRFEDGNIGTRELHVHAITGEVTSQFEQKLGYKIRAASEELMNKALEMMRSELQFQELSEIQAMVLGDQWIVIHNPYSWSTSGEIVTNDNGEVEIQVYWEYEEGY